MQVIGLALINPGARFALRLVFQNSFGCLAADMFCNTGISTYVWCLSNRKPDERKGFVQLMDASSFCQKMRKSLGSKRKAMSDEHIARRAW